MKNGFASAVSVVLLAALIYAGWYAGFWTVMNAWTWNDWTIFFLGVLIAWIARNEFDGTNQGRV